MVTSEREMVRKLDEEAKAEQPRPEKFTSLQPTYEDSIPPDLENDWEHED